MISIHHSDSSYVYVSDSIQRLAGYHPSKLVGQGVVDLVHPEDLATVTESIGQLCVELQSVELEWRFRHSKGHYLWLRSHFVGDFSSNGKLIRVIVGSRDVTERKTIEEHLRQSKKLQALGLLAGGISHDFNNLLTVVIGCAELLQEERPDDSIVSDLASDIRRAGERGAALTRQMLAFCRQNPLMIETLDLNEIVSGSSKMLSRLVNDSITIKTQLHPTSLLVRTDASQLEQVLFNLVVNARDAMPSGGIVKIQTGIGTISEDVFPLEKPDRQQFVHVSVRDTGTGITPEVRGRIFDPFFTTKPVGHGTGLGLSVVYGIVQSLRGYIDVQSEPGFGAVFNIYLPLVTAAQDAELQGQLSGRMSQSMGVGILVVEDDPTVLRLAESLLTKAGFVVFTAENALEALELYDRLPEPPTVIVADLVLPGMTGQQLADCIWQRHPRQKILFISGYASAHLNRLGYDSGLLGVVSKPFQSDSLVLAVRKLLLRSQV